MFAYEFFRDNMDARDGVVCSSFRGFENSRGIFTETVSFLRVSVLYITLVKLLNTM